MAGLCAADHMYELDAPLFELAAELEGHPDNVAAALLGGFVIASDAPVQRRAAGRAGGGPGDPGVRGAYRSGQGGDSRLGPARRRGANIASSSLLVLGLARGDLSLIQRGLTDALHQPHRRSLYERSMELVEAAPSLGALGATISGAGPTVLFWSHWEQTGALIERLRSEAPDCQVRRVTFAPGGADVNEL